MMFAQSQDHFDGTGEEVARTQPSRPAVNIALEHATPGESLGTATKRTSSVSRPVDSPAAYAVTDTDTEHAEALRNRGVGVELSDMMIQSDDAGSALSGFGSSVALTIGTAIIMNPNGGEWVRKLASGVFYLFIYFLFCLVFYYVVTGLYLCHFLVSLLDSLFLVSLRLASPPHVSICLYSASSKHRHHSCRQCGVN